MDEKIKKHLREKITHGLKLQGNGPPLSNLLLLVQDLNFLIFRLLRELGALSSGGYLSPEIIAALLRTEPGCGKRIITLGEELLGHSERDLLHGAGLISIDLSAHTAGFS